MPARPNVLWIFPDQLRNDALGYYGHRCVQVQTPNIDRIATAGVRFERCFVTSPVCVPSRMSFMTGLYPERTGVYHNEAAWPSYRLDQAFDTFPQVFARHGYRTASFGKTHLPRAIRPWPLDEHAGSAHTDLYRGLAPAAIEALRTAEPRGVRGGVFPPAHIYTPEQVTENTLAWIDEQDGVPFLVRAGYLQPHDPVVVPEPFASMYSDAPFAPEADLEGNRSRFERRFGELGGMAQLSPEAFRRQQALYYGLVAWLDAQVGRLLDHLASRGLLQNTIVIFNADHGMLLGEGGGYAKQIFAPQSQRVPLLLRWDGGLPAGMVRDDLTDNTDFAHTLLGLAGIETPAQFGGRDLFSQPPREAVYGTIGYGERESRAFPNGGRGTFVDDQGEHGWPRRACVRTSRFRLDRTVRFDGRPPRPQEDIFLADSLADPDERWNLAADAAYAEPLATLTRLLDSHLADAVEVPGEQVTMTPEQLQRYRQTAGEV